MTYNFYFIKEGKSNDEEKIFGISLGGDYGRFAPAGRGVCG